MTHRPDGTMTLSRTLLVLPVLLGLPALAAAQTAGAIAGHVRDVNTGRGIALARVDVDGRGDVATSDTSGGYRIRGVQAGWHRVSVRFIGYRGEIRDSVLVRTNATTVVDFNLTPTPTVLEPLVVRAVDSVLDPFATSTTQRITAADLRELPVSSLDEALALSAGAVGESYRGGRLGQQAFILDGLGVKNQLDASTGPLGLRLAHHQRFLGPLWPGALRIDQRGHQGRGRGDAGPRGVRNRPSAG
jgi:hypothetical protein